jgi:hypothetical protein
MEFVFHSDAGHGWVEVSMDMVRDLGIASSISSFSYRRGNMAYLEEDCDAGLLIQALQKSGVSFRFKEINDGDDSPIRNYKRFYV